MAKVTSTGIATGYRMLFTAYLYRFWASDVELGVEIPPPPSAPPPPRRVLPGGAPRRGLILILPIRTIAALWDVG